MSTLTEVRKRAWITRRQKYGPAGHNGAYTRWASDPVGQRALALVLGLHEQAILSEGQCCKALDLDRVEFREMYDIWSSSNAQ